MADALPFDGLMAVGVVDRVESIVSPKTGQILKGLSRAFLTCERGELRLDLQDFESGMYGREELPAFEKLPKLVGKRVCVVVYLKRSGTFTNTVAVDCAELPGLATGLSKVS
jgi:hypothetical protein